MARDNKDIEKLIGRHLDGLLDDDEQLDFDRELIRDPQIRQTLEETQEIERLAGDALRDTFDQTPVAIDFDALPPQASGPSPRVRPWIWGLVPGAIAAALLAVFVAQFPLTPTQESRPTLAGGGQSTPVLPIDSPRVRGTQDIPTRNIGTAGTTTRPKIKRAIGRDVFGVVGDDGNIYWVEVDRTRMLIRRPTAPQPF